MANATDVAFSPDGQTAYITDYFDGAIIPITVATGKVGTPITGAGSSATGIAITPDGDTAIVTNTNDPGGVTLVNLTTGQAGSPLPGNEYPTGVSLSSDGSTALIVNEFGVQALNVADGTLSAQIDFGSTSSLWYGAIVPTPQASTSPVFTSFATASFNLDQSSNFEVQATGATSYAESGALPQGVTFADNGDGTATISGTPAAGTAGPYPIHITATGSGGSTTQNFVLDADAPGNHICGLAHDHVRSGSDVQGYDEWVPFPDTELQRLVDNQSDR